MGGQANSRSAIHASHHTSPYTFPLPSGPMTPPSSSDSSLFLNALCIRESYKEQASYVPLTMAPICNPVTPLPLFCLCFCALSSNLINAVLVTRNCLEPPLNVITFSRREQMNLTQRLDRSGVSTWTDSWQHDIFLRQNATCPQVKSVVKIAID